MNINAIQKWARNSLLIFGDESMCTCTGLLHIPIESAGTRVHRGDQLKIGAEHQRPFGPANGDNFVFHAEVDINFRLHFKIYCNPQAGTATLKITTTDFSSSVDAGILDDVITLGIIEFFEDDIAEAIENAFQPITQTIVVTTGGLCPTVQVDVNGNIIFQPS